jgi:hypothetical protein
VIVPAGRQHGFRNTGRSTLHVQATLAAPIFEASLDDRSELTRALGAAAVRRRLLNRKLGMQTYALRPERHVIIRPQAIITM